PRYPSLTFPPCRSLSRLNGKRHGFHPNATSVTAFRAAANTVRRRRPRNLHLLAETVKQRQADCYFGYEAENGTTGAPFSILLCSAPGLTISSPRPSLSSAQNHEYSGRSQLLGFGEIRRRTAGAADRRCEAGARPRSLFR